MRWTIRASHRRTVSFEFSEVLSVVSDQLTGIDELLDLLIALYTVTVYAHQRRKLNSCGLSRIDGKDLGDSKELVLRRLGRISTLLTANYKAIKNP